MRTILFTTLTLLLMALSANPLSAQSKKTTTARVYMFGCSTSFKDSVTYLTSVQEVKNASIDKNNFLIDRNLYSAALELYIENTFGVPHETAAIFWGTKRESVEKKFLRMRKKLLQRKENMREISAEEYTFVSPETEEEQHPLQNDAANE